MATVVGIDLGTTNSVVSALDDGKPWAIPNEEGDVLLPSCVGFNEAGQLLVGQIALRQYAAAPERTVMSIKRQIGTDYVVNLNDTDYRPQEISAIILKSLKQRAEEMLEDEVTQAVITVPAYFTDAQRQATKEAGEIAGLEVLQILNEPTSAALVFDERSDDTQTVLVYDLGGGTFDVSIVEMTGEVTEVLASHGNNRLGGDDFDRQLQRYLGDRFQETHQTDVPDDAAIQARLHQAAEKAKIALSSQAFVTVREAYLASKGETALHLETELDRTDFEKLIQPMLQETLEAIDRALKDADMEPDELDRVILVGGSTRIPLVQKLVQDHLSGVPVSSFEPDLCVGLGAAMQAGVLSGEDVDSILVDVIPHSLGIAASMPSPMGELHGMFSTIIPRNSVIPVSRSEIYTTGYDNQATVMIEVFQGENAIANENVPLGEFKVEDLPRRPAGSLKIEVNFDFDLNGILTVTATEKGKGGQESLVVNNAETGRLSSTEISQSKDTVSSLFDNMADHLFSMDEDEEGDDQDDGDDGNGGENEPKSVDVEVVD
ncbi:MAG: Hsp70 family protein [Cyanobacteria bacterium P01_F01_bin.150]